MRRLISLLGTKMTTKVTVLVLFVIMMIGASWQLQLGMEDGRITDAQITASSCWDINRCTDRARLNQPASGAKTGAWSARTNNLDQYIQVDLRQLHEISGIMTQGRNALSQWVTSFKVLYSLDGLTWTAAGNAMTAGGDIFDGNFDRDTIVTNDFANDLAARFVRIEPVTWANHTSMRFELLGKVVSKIQGPQIDLGMRKEQIPDNALTASSEYGSSSTAERARLDIITGAGKAGAWSARTNDGNQWLQVDLNKFYIVTGVITQGRRDANQWVTSFRVASSDDGFNWNFIKDCNGVDEIFTGNTDRSTKITTSFDRPIATRFMRIHPVTWNGHISMRLEILGKGALANNRFEPSKLGMEDGRIADNQLSSSTCFNASHFAGRARLNQVAGNGRACAWSAQINDDSQWIQVDLLSNHHLQGIETQGRSDADQWVTKFTIQYRPDEQTTLSDVVDDSGTIVNFDGNSDRDSLVVNMLPLPVTARYVRIRPEIWNGHISMRFELLGVPANATKVPGKLGIEDGRIATTSLSASSCWNGDQCVDRSRLNQPKEGMNQGAWCALINNVNQWIQVDLRSAFEVTGVITQGRNGNDVWDQWVTSYKVSYSIDGKDWILVKDCQEAKIFSGNTDRDSVVENPIYPSVTARFFRLHPVTWHKHISLRWELIGEGPVMISDSAKLGLEDYRIPDGAITASSQSDANQGPQRARLNLPLSGALKGAWSAQINDHSQWLQVDLRGTYRVTGIITQGRACLDQWVTRYKVAHGLNGQDFTVVTSPGCPGYPQEKVFDGNSDRSTQVTHNFVPPLTTRYVRVLPYMWHGHISMRMELLGAGPVAAILNDPVPLGLESRVIPDSNLTASSEWDVNHGPKRARLNVPRVGALRGAWSAQTNNVNQWIQVDLSEPYRIIAVATQGRQDLDQWVTSYKLACSDDGVTFDTVQGIFTNPGAYRIFTANADRDTVVRNDLPVPEICRYVRLLPVSWYGHISLRMEIYGEGPLAV